MFTSITKVENNRITKYAEFENQSDAQSHAKEFNGFVYKGAYSPDLWVENGKVTINPIKETPEEATARLESYLDAYIDAQAREFRYESIRTMVTYVGDPNSQFNAEGLGALEFRSRCYTLALMIISEVQQGRPIPTEKELIAEMPTLASFINY